jgi:capsid portal protein
MQSGLRGQNHRTLIIPLPGDTDSNKVEFEMKPIEAGIQEGSFDKYRKSNKEDVLMAHQVPLSKVGGGSGISIASSLASDRTFKEQVCRPKQRALEKLINKIVKEKTDIVKFKFNELSLTDELAQSQIDERYLRNKVVVPNEVRQRLNLPNMDGGNNPIQITPQQQAEQNAQANNSRQRDQQREANASDSPNTISGRNPGGEGRRTP